MDDSLYYRFIERPIEVSKQILGFIYFMYLFSRPEMSCDEDSKAYDYAHTLTSSRLEQIYLDLEKYALGGVEFKGITNKSVGRPLEFEDIEYTRIIMDKHNILNGTAIIRLSFCIDQSIDLELNGIKSDKPVIKLVWGELERTEETLWQK